MTKILAPCANAPLDRVCQYGYGTHSRCELNSVADAQTVTGRWAYLCISHLRSIGTRNTDLINNITKEDLELTWL